MEMISYGDWYRQLWHRAEIMKVIDMRKVTKEYWAKYWLDGYSPREAIRAWVSYHMDEEENKSE